MGLGILLRAGLVVVLASQAALVAQPLSRFDKWRQPSFFRGFDVGYYCSESDCVRTQDDVYDLKKTGANLAQINVFGESYRFPDPPYAVNPAGQASLAEMVGFCRQAGLYYTIAVRVGPGRHDVADDEPGHVSTLWHPDSTFQVAMYGKMLKEIAADFSSDSLFVGLNLTVEPNPFPEAGFGGPADLRQVLVDSQVDLAGIYRTWIDSVRTVDATLPLIVQSAQYSNPEFWGDDLFLSKQADSLIVYDFHSYEPFDDYTHHPTALDATYPVTTWNESVGSAALWDSTFYADVVFAKVRAFEQAHDVPIFMGEFGMQFPQVNGDAYLRDLYEIAVGLGWHFALWSWRTDASADFIDFDYEKFDAASPGADYWNTVQSFFVRESQAGDPQGRTFTVAVDGDDGNAGTLAQPWRTIQKAANTAAAGDTVEVRGGVYTESVRVTVSGSAEGGDITFRSYAGETAVVDGSGLSVQAEPNGLIYIEDQHHVIIDGFEIRNYRTSTPGLLPTGIHVRGSAHHIQLKHNRIHLIENMAPVDSDLLGADAHGIAVYGTSVDASVHDVLIEGNLLYDLKLGSSEALVVNGNVDGFTIRDNVIHDCDNIGIDLIGFEGTVADASVDQARNGVVIGNTVYDVSSSGNPAYGGDFSAGGIYVDGGRAITIERNRVYRCDIGVEIASEHAGRATRDVTVRSNFLYHNRLSGIAMGGYDSERGSTENCVVVNNTLYHNDSLKDGNGELLVQFDTRNNTIRNNILFANDQGLLIGNAFSENTGNDVEGNVYFASGGSGGEWMWTGTLYEGLSAYQAGSGKDAQAVFVDPDLVDEAAPDLHLKSTSPAIDFGMVVASVGDFDFDGDVRVQGSGIDAGADETGTGSGGSSGDFDGDGSVGFNDFLLFAGAFGGVEAQYDLDGSGRVGFGDFLVFAGAFGK